MTISPPIVVIDGSDISIYKSVSEAERHLEGPDVKDGRYLAYDSEGRLLKLDAIGVKRTSLFVGISMVDIGYVKITAESETLHVEPLKDLLIKFLTRFSIDGDWLHRASLNELLNACITHIGFTR
jgi:hypothetical protein